MALHTIVEHDTTHIKPYIDNVKQALSNEVVTRSTLGAHNLLPFPWLDITKTTNGVTFTNNQDGSITVSRATSANESAYFFFSDVNHKIYLPHGTYKVVGLPSQLRGFGNFIINDGTNIALYEDGTFTTTSDYVYMFLQIYKEFTATNVTFSPMILLPSDSDTTYRPYVPTNSQLLSYKDNGVLGAKNWFDLKSSNYISITSGATSTKTSTGINIQSSTATTNIGVQYPINPLKTNTDYILSCNVIVTSGTSRIFLVGSKAGQEDVRILNTGNNISGNVSYDFNSGDYDSIKFVFYCSASTSQTGNVTYNDIMLRLASDTDPTYQPYAPTNRECLSHYQNGVLGAKNFALNFNGNESLGNITFTRNADDSITITGSDTVSREYILASRTSKKLFLPNGRYILSGYVDANNYVVVGNTKNNGWHWIADTSAGDEVEFTISGDDFSNKGAYLSCYVAAKGGNSAVTIYPMIRLASDTDPTYQPFAMTNKQLTDNVIESHAFVGRDYISVIADGVKTNKTLLNELSLAMSNYISTHDYHTRMERFGMGNSYGAFITGVGLDEYFGASFIFTINDVNSSIVEAIVHSTLNYCEVRSFNLTTATYTDMTNSVPTSGTNYSIYFSKYKKN